MLRQYIQAAMRQARYEILADDGSYYGEITGFDGVFANAPELENCRDQLEQVLEDWVFLSISERHPIPVLEGIDLTVKETA